MSIIAKKMICRNAICAIVYMGCLLFPSLRAADAKGKKEMAGLVLAAQPAQGGRVDGAGKYAQGSIVDIQAYAAEGFVFVRWVGSVTDSSSSATQTYVGAKEQKVVAIFEPQKYALEANVVPAGGGTVEGVGYQPGGVAAQIIAHPAPGYAFDRWEGPVASTTSPATSLRAPLSKTLTLTAHFKPAEAMYTVAMLAEPAAGGKVIGSGKYPRGTDVAIKAVPAPGYLFNGWVGPVSNMGRAETTLYVTADTALRAKFTLNRSLVRARVLPEGAGRVTGDLGPRPVGVAASVKAEAAPGFVFVRWEGPVANPSTPSTTVTPAAGKTAGVTAIFKQAQ